VQGFFGNDFALILVLAGDRIITRQIAVAKYAVVSDHNQNLIKCKRFRSRHGCDRCTIIQTELKNQTESKKETQ